MTEDETGSAETGPGGPRAMSRTLRLLDQLAGAPDGLSLADLSVALETPKSTLLNSLKPLASDGFLIAEGARYRLGPRAFRLAVDISAAWSLPSIARGFLREISEQTGETAALAVLEPHKRRFVYVDVVESSQPVRYVTRVGMSGPLYATAAGRVLLAHQTGSFLDAYLQETTLAPLTANTNTDPEVLRRQLEQIRRQGYWVSAGESVADSAAVAAPVFGPAREVEAAFCIAAPLKRLTANQDVYVRAVTHAAARASGARPGEGLSPEP